MNFLKKIVTILWKDLLTELRTKEKISSMFVFSLIVIVVFNFSFSTGALQMRKIASGILWVAFIFSGTLGLNRSFAQEQDRGSLQGLLLCPVDRSAIYLGKMVGNFIFITIIELITLLPFAVFLNVPIIHVLPQLLLIILLGTLGFCCVGTLFAAISANTKMRDVMLPVLLFPVISPIIIASVQATGAILDGAEFGEITRWIGLLIAFIAIFLAASVIVFDFVIEE